MRTMSIYSVFRCRLWLVMSVCLACLNANAQGGKGKNKKRNRPTQVKSATTKAEESQRVMCEIFETPPQFPGGYVALMEFIKKEALRVAKMMPKWIPGSIYGKLVTSRCCIVVAFKGRERGGTESERKDKYVAF